MNNDQFKRALIDQIHFIATMSGRAPSSLLGSMLVVSALVMLSVWHIVHSDALGFAAAIVALGSAGVLQIRALDDARLVPFALGAGLVFGILSLVGIFA